MECGGEAAAAAFGGSASVVLHQGGLHEAPDELHVLVGGGLGGELEAQQRARGLGEGGLRLWEAVELAQAERGEDEHQAEAKDVNEKGAVDAMALAELGQE